MSDTAANLATITDTTVRRQAATRALEDRRAQLVTYRALLVEKYGEAGVPRLERILDADRTVTELRIIATA